MRKIIFKIAQRLYFAHFLPWNAWSAIYDKYHRLFTIEEKYI